MTVYLSLNVSCTAAAGWHTQMILPNEQRVEFIYLENAPQNCTEDATDGPRLKLYVAQQLRIMTCGQATVCWWTMMCAGFVCKWGHIKHTQLITAQWRWQCSILEPQILTGLLHKNRATPLKRRSVSVIPDITLWFIIYYPLGTWAALIYFLSPFTSMCSFAAGSWSWRRTFGSTELHIRPRACPMANWICDRLNRYSSIDVLPDHRHQAFNSIVL